MVQLLSRRKNSADIRRAAHGHGIPGITEGVWSDGGFQRPLGADHQELAITKMRSESQQIEGIGAAAMQGQDRRVWPCTPGFIDCMNQLHVKSPSNENFLSRQDAKSAKKKCFPFSPNLA